MAGTPGIVHKRTEQAQVSRAMDPENRPAWQRYVDEHYATKAHVERHIRVTMKGLVDATGDVLGKHVKQLSDRIVALEAGIAVLKATTNLEVRLAKLEGKRNG